ncbi:hypothetical protein [Nannocystis pusilla]|uniref:hypothetical protein n=1 Tax=Nannocystis pusilla TaxID=889268 RepID=UPI003B7B6069
MRRPLLVLAVLLACGPDTASDTESSGTAGTTTGTDGGSDSQGTTGDLPTDPAQPTTGDSATVTGTTGTDDITDSSSATTASTGPAAACNEIVLADPSVEESVRWLLESPRARSPSRPPNRWRSSTPPPA